MFQYFFFFYSTMPEGTLKGVDGEDTDINNTDIYAGCLL